MVAVRFFKMSIMTHCIYANRVVKNQHFQSTLLGGRGSQKRVLCSTYAVVSTNRNRSNVINQYDAIRAT